MINFPSKPWLQMQSYNQCIYIKKHYTNCNNQTGLQLIKTICGLFKQVWPLFEIIKWVFNSRSDCQECHLKAFSDSYSNCCQHIWQAFWKSVMMPNVVLEHIYRIFIFFRLAVPLHYWWISAHSKQNGYIFGHCIAMHLQQHKRVTCSVMAYNLNFQLTEFKFPAQNYALNTATMSSKTNASQLVNSLTLRPLAVDTSSVNAFAK